jgi:hypothetical protein
VLQRPWREPWEPEALVRNRIDQLGKQIGQRALMPCGTTVTHDEISPDAQHADLRHEPVVSRTAERARLGLLLMAGGALLPQAVEELSTLPGHAHERAVAGPILLNLEHVLGQKPDRTREEQEFIMTMRDSWEKAREQGLKQGLDKGHREGRAQEAAKSVLTVLRTRGIRVPKEVRERILAQKDPELLNRWLKRAIRATAATEVFQEPNWV